MENIDRLNYEIDELRNIKLQINELRKLYEIIDNKNIKKELKEIIIISDDIYKEVALNTEKLSKIKRFSTYYIITVQKILTKYCNFKEKKIVGLASKELYAKVEDFIPKVKMSFKKMYQSLFDDDITDVDAEITVMLKQLGI